LKHIDGLKGNQGEKEHHSEIGDGLFDINESQMTAELVKPGVDFQNINESWTLPSDETAFAVQTHRTTSTKKFPKLLKKILYIMFLSFLAFFFYTHAHKLKKGERLYNDSFSQILSNIKNSLETGNFGVLTSNLQDMGKITSEAQLFSESFGQNLPYFNILHSKSRITRSLTLLNVIADITKLPERIEVDKDGILKKPGSDYLADLTLLGKSSISLINQVSDELKFQQGRLQFYDDEKSVQLRDYIDRMEVIFAKAGPLLTKDLPWLSVPDAGQKNILIIFQNNDELRGGSGGSFGSFGIAKFEGGKLRNIDFGTNIYKLDDAFLKREQIPAPTELEAFNGGYLTLKQSGFSVDGKEALDTIRDFYEKEAVQHVDGAITIDTTAFISLLKVIGPIAMPAYNLEVNADNFRLAVENEVQVTYFGREGGMKENEPKKMLGDMMPIVIDRIAECGKAGSCSLIVSSLVKSMESKNILFNFENDDFQNRLQLLNLTGEVKPTTADYFYLNNSNLAGAKTNQSMIETAKIDVRINDDGTIQNSLELIRQHTGKNEFPNGLDRNYVRFLVPEESKLLNFVPLSGNFERYCDRGYHDGQPSWISKEAGKTVINFWMSTIPGDTSRAKIEYRPNYKVQTNDNFDYSILFQKQPGAPNDKVELTIYYPLTFFPENVKDSYNGKMKLNFDLQSDKEITLHFKKI